jgi:hypothetical protein
VVINELKEVKELVDRVHRNVRVSDANVTDQKHIEELVELIQSKLDKTIEMVEKEDG